MIKRVMLFLAILLSCSFSIGAILDIQEGFVKVKENRELYMKWTKAKPGLPTIVLLNGLTYGHRYWKPFAEELIQKGFGVFQFDPYGMGETLLKYAPMREVIQITDQATEMKILLEKLGVPKPYHFLGLSYGGGLALVYAQLFPQDVKNLILMAPYTEPIKSQDKWIKSMIVYTRQFNPYVSQLTDDELYDIFLRQIMYTTYPMAEPSILENQYKMEATFRMIQGIRHWNYREALPYLPKTSVHLIIAGWDQYIVDRNVLLDFWKNVPGQVKASSLLINYTEHKIPEVIPSFASSWVKLIVMDDPRVFKGAEFQANPFIRTVTPQNGPSFLLPRE